MKIKSLIVCILTVLLMPVLIGCTQPPEETSSTVGATVSIASLSDEAKSNIECAWLEEKGYDINWDVWWGETYYGAYNGYDIIFSCGTKLMQTYYSIGSYEFSHGSTFQIYAFKDGEFTALGDAYDAKAFGDGVIAEIYSVHQAMASKIPEEFPSQSISAPPLPPLSDEQAAELKSISSFDPTTDTYYGTYNGYSVYFSEGSFQLMLAETKIVAGEIFSNPNSFSITVCGNGNSYSLFEAYNRGYLSEKDISLIAYYHRNRLLNSN